ncbi:MAG: ATP-dependent Clp protease adapter ClpS [Pseudomonadota bacterium]|nr:ATP-dependent Clp protease adapter ClpS [Pseudomonadota bacterium]
MTENKPNQENEYSTLSVVKVDIKPPSLYKVILVNDDYTPMDFVVEILVSIFKMNKSFATRVMLDVHTKGAGVCGIYTYEIAETFVAQVTKMAKQHQHPLLCSMEED